MKTKYKNKEVVFCKDCNEAVLICGDCKSKSCLNGNCEKCKNVLERWQIVQHVYTDIFANKENQKEQIETYKQNKKESTESNVVYA